MIGAVRHLNPAETERFKYKHARLPDMHKADTALTWRERAVNAVMAANPTLGTTAGHLATALGFAGVVGWMDGLDQDKQAKMVETWRTQTAPSLGLDPVLYPSPFVDIVDPDTKEMIHKAEKNPRDLWILNKQIVWGLVPGVLSIALGNSRPGIAGYLRAPAYAAIGAGVSAMVAETSRRAAYRARTTAAQRTVAQGGNNQVQEQNPYRGYPRAA